MDEEKQGTEENEYKNTDHKEETAAEIAAPVIDDREDHTVRERERDGDEENSGSYIGIAALVLSIISLFTMPILFGVAGIIVGFMARRRGAESLGIWAIGIGAVAVVMGLFVLPFF
ncbi:DUF4190 domain-containing protein [Bacillus sp. FSL W8-0116]|uniref:DUF4190 domain-containing protein n=1 Tax=Bacillus sp. FSL W8-0116 TaxID=2978206 RepID=UPI0011CB7D6B|nr:DUF4190 domain-containing protein [Bacillus smithii]